MRYEIKNIDDGKGQLVVVERGAGTYQPKRYVLQVGEALQFSQYDDRGETIKILSARKPYGTTKA